MAGPFRRGAAAMARGFLALRADAVKVYPMTQNLKSGGAGQVFGQMRKRFQIGIDDAATLHADQVGMRFWHADVVAVASIPEPDLNGLSQFFEQGNGFVNRCQAGCWKGRLDGGINRFHAGMARGVGQLPEDGQSLGGDPVAGLLEGVYYLMDSG